MRQLLEVFRLCEIIYKLRLIVSLIAQDKNKSFEEVNLMLTSAYIFLFLCNTEYSILFYSMVLVIYSRCGVVYFTNKSQDSYYQSSIALSVL